MAAGAGEVLGYLALVTVVFLVPAAAGLLVAVWAGITSRPAQAICALAAPCLVGYAAGGFYLLSAPAGRAADVAAYAAVVVVGAAAAWRCGAERTRAALGWWAAPALMAPAAAAVSLGIGFLHGGTESVFRVEWVRYFDRIAGDNALPWQFALQLLAPTRPLPHYLSGHWLSSDRPPLQTSVYLLARAVLPMGDQHELVYQTLGTLLQSLWVPALWCVLTVVGLPRRAIAGAVAAVAVSGFVLFNSFYVWPKLFPAAFLVLLAGIVLTPEWRTVRRRVAGGVACGLGTGLAVLGHQESVLALVPLAVLLLAVPRRWPRWRCLVPAAGVVLVLTAPWMLYQRYVDPPGTNLTELQLAGGPAPGKGLLSAVVGAYEHETASRFWHDKWSNVHTVGAGEPQEVRSLATVAANLFATSGSGAARRSVAVQDLRYLSYEWFLPALGLFVLGPAAWALAAWLRRQRGPDIDFARRIWVFLLLAAVFWSLVLFGPHATSVEQGSYAFELLAVAGGVIGLWRLSRVLAGVVMALQVGIGLATSLAASAAIPASSLALFGPLQPGEALLAAGGLLLVALLPLVAPGLPADVEASPPAAMAAVPPTTAPPAEVPALVGT